MKTADRHKQGQPGDEQAGTLERQRDVVEVRGELVGQIQLAEQPDLHTDSLKTNQVWSRVCALGLRREPPVGFGLVDSSVLSPMARREPRR